MATPDVTEHADTAKEAGRSVYRSILDVILTGIVVIVPLVITIYVLKMAFDFVASALKPFIQLLRYGGLIESVKEWGFVDFLITVGIYTNVVDFVTEVTALFILVCIVVGVGLLARNRYGEQLIDYFDAVIGAIPAVGSIYGSFRRMGDAMLESSVDNFQEVVLVEFPYDDVYVIGFKTSEAAVPIAAAAGERDVETLFLPLAPNPVMGGFLAHIPAGRVTTVDMTVDQAVSTIITSGIATESPDDQKYRDLSDEELAEMREVAAPTVNDSTQQADSDEE